MSVVRGVQAQTARLGGSMDEHDVLRFYERTAGDVYRYASRLNGGDPTATADLVQEVYLTLIRQVRSGRCQPVDIGWAITTCRSRYIDEHRRRDRRARLVPSWEEHPPQPLYEGVSDATAALAGLPEAQRLAVVLRYFDDLSVPEVAELMGRSVHATESLLARARSALRTALASTDHEE